MLEMPEDDLFFQICAWPNLWLAWQRAAKGKRGGMAAARFEFRLADELLQLQEELRNETYRPGPYTHFVIEEPKRRIISAAPFRDRVVHHALCNVIEPLFERHFISDSYANRIGKGTHRAIKRFQMFSRRYAYCLCLDIRKHFESIDHAILKKILAHRIQDERVMALIGHILRSGENIPGGTQASLFPGDDLLDLCRPKGLPIGNLTSQFWSNCYLHPVDQFIKRELGCWAYLRYVDDLALFSNNKKFLWQWKQAIAGRLAELRLRFHEGPAQVRPVQVGIPWLGFVIFPTHLRLKARKVAEARRHLVALHARFLAGEISYARFKAAIQGWIAHVGHGDTWGLRESILSRLSW